MLSGVTVSFILPELWLGYTDQIIRSQDATPNVFIAYVLGELHRTALKNKI